MMMRFLKSRLWVKRLIILLALLALSVCVFLARDWMARRKHPVSAITVSMPAEPPGAVGDVGLAIVAAARGQVGQTVTYDPAYIRLKYPLGDIPIERGVCTDVIVRALRDALAMDLQRLVHRDMWAAFLFYPKRWGPRLPDKNIDHRRVLNLMRYFERKGFSIPVSENPEDYLPGDIIANEIHIMIVSDRKTEQGEPLIIHNIGSGAREEKGFHPNIISAHYRITHKGKQSRLNNGVVLAGVVLLGALVMLVRKRRQ